MKTNLSQYLRTLLLALALTVSVSSFYVIPLRAGTTQITDNDLRSNKIIKKQIDLNMTKDFYEAHKDITVVASISSLTMDDKLNFYFQYNIFCPTKNCLLNFTVVRKSQKVNPQFTYHVQADYLIARGLKILQLNMTSYQEHLNLMFIDSYNQKNEKEDLSKFQPYNNQDAMRILLIPNGFSNLTRTGRVQYLYNAKDMYVVHYMQPENGHNQQDAMGWPQGKDHIRYKALFFSAQYLPSACKHDDQWALTKSYRHLCGIKNLTKWFFGFKSTKERSIQGWSKQEAAGYRFNVTKQGRYGVLGFPFQGNSQFIDLRTTKYNPEKQQQQQQIRNQEPNKEESIDDLLTLIVFSVVIVLLVLLFILIIKLRKMSSSEVRKQNFNQLDGKSETFDSQREETKSIENVVLRQIKQSA